MPETSIPYFYSSRFIHSDCGSSPVKMAIPTGEHCWKKNSGPPWARTSNLWIPSLTRSPLRHLGRYAKWDLSSFNKLCDVPCRALHYIKIVAAFRGMHVSPAKHSYASVTDGQTDGRTDGQMDGRTTDKVIPMCRYASRHKYEV